jgi:hypothetical protein
MTLDDYIANFLRDAQYKIAVLSVEMNEIADQGSYQYKTLYKSREYISGFMAILYEGKWLINSGYNHMQVGEEEMTWTEREIKEEIDYLRYYYSMNEVPYVTFTAHYPKIVSIINGGGSGSGTSLPAGQYGQLMGFSQSGVAQAEDIDEWAGHLDGETITSYFNGRL